MTSAWHRMLRYTAHLIVLQSACIIKERMVTLYEAAVCVHNQLERCGFAANKDAVRVARQLYAHKNMTLCRRKSCLYLQPRVQSTSTHAVPRSRPKFDYGDADCGCRRSSPIRRPLGRMLVARLKSPFYAHFQCAGEFHRAFRHDNKLASSKHGY